MLGQVVRNPVNANPGLKVDRTIIFSCVKILFPYVLCSLRLLKLKTEEQTIQNEHLTEKMQNSNQNSH